MKRIFAVLAAIALFASAAYSADGFAVTMQEASGDFNDEIIKFTIQNNKVTGKEVLFKGKCGGRDARPVISFDGKKVAFAGQREGDAQSAIFVVDSDGKNLKSLVSPAYMGCTERYKALDWPAGPYVYYKQSKTAMYRVNIDNPSDNGLAVTVPIKAVARYERIDSLRFRKWSISADGKRSGIQWEMCNVITNFPLEIARMDECVGGCNIHLSAGGNYYCNLSDAGHVQIHISQWKPNSYDVEKVGYWHNDSMSRWAGTDIGKGMDWPRWSTNSDKWICLQVGRGCDGGSGLGGRFMGCGSNQVLFNWKDKVVIMTTNQPDRGRWVCAGDMWIKPPTGVTNSYETADGQWVAVNYDPTSAISPSSTMASVNNAMPVMISGSRIAVSAKLSSGENVLGATLYDAAGRICAKASVSQNAGILEFSRYARLSARLHVVQIETSQRSFRAPVMMP